MPLYCLEEVRAKLAELSGIVFQGQYVKTLGMITSPVVFKGAYTE